MQPSKIAVASGLRSGASRELVAQLRTVLEVAPMALLAVDRAGVLTLAEGSALARLHPGGGELVGRAVSEVYRDAPWLVEAAQRALGGASRTSIGQHEGLWWKAECATLRDARGEAEGAVLVATEAAELRQLSELVARLDAIVWIADAATPHLSFVSARAEALLGFPLERWYREPTLWLERLSDEDRAAALAVTRAVAADGVTRQLEHCVRAADGRSVWFSTTVQSFPVGVAPAQQLVGLMVDVTERAQARDALLKNEARLRTVVAQIPGTLWTMDRDLVVTRVEGSTVGLFLEALGPLVGRSVAELCAQMGIDPMVVESHKRALGGATARHTSEWQGRAFETRVDPLRGPSGEIVGTIGLMLDITEQRRAEEALAALTRELEARVAERTASLEAANRELESFSYSVSHDLRAPLRAIEGFSVALLEDCGGQLGPQCQDYLRRVRAAAQRMAQLIDALLALSRVTRGELHPTAVDLSALARSVAEELARERPERSVEWVIAEGLTARGDPPLLRAVLVNLLGNAWKFTARQDRARIEFGATERDGRRVFYVRDNGAGFDMAQAGRLFGAFQRLDTAEGFEGTGIGLATVRRIVRRHGGKIWAEGTVDRGATFSFTL